MNRNTSTGNAEKVKNYFAEKISKCNEKAKALSEDERQDEANFEKIRANVYGIFSTILSVAGNTCNGDVERERQFIELRMQSISASWADAYTAAQEHNDSKKMEIERIKLETAHEIMGKFEEYGVIMHDRE